MLVLSAETPPSGPTSNLASANRLDVPGLRDVAVKKYSDWQQSKVDDEMLKAEF